MKKALLFIAFLILTNRLSAQSFNPNYDSPLVVLTETNPWLMVIGSDVPSFVLYAKGQVIFKEIVNKTVKYYEVKLSPQQLKQTIASLGITDSLKMLRRYIEASSWTDQGTSQLILNLDSTKEISVYGNLRYKEGDARKKAPRSFLTVYDNIIAFDRADKKEWLPDSVELMLSRYDHSPEKPLFWPAQWPGLTDKTTVQRSPDLYSVYLDKKYFAAFLKLNASLKEKQAFKINGQKFSVSYRLPFPNMR